MLPLSKIVIASTNVEVSSAEVKKIILNDDENLETTISDIAIGGEILFDDEKLDIISCEPFKSGRVTATTEVIIQQKNPDALETDENDQIGVGASFDTELEDITCSACCSNFTEPALYLNYVGNDSSPKYCEISISDCEQKKVLKIQPRSRLRHWHKRGKYGYLCYPRSSPATSVSSIKLLPQNKFNSDCLSENIPFATKLSISIVNSPNYSAKVDCDDDLEQYFREPKLLALGDLIAIKRLGYDDIIFFKVASIEGANNQYSQWLVDKIHTALYQGPPCHSYAPTPCQSSYDDVFTCPSANPPYLSSYVTRMVKMFRPHTTKRRSLRPPCVLLAGPSGCGKSMCVRSVASILNLHYREVDCANLLADTASAHEAKISNVLTEGWHSVQNFSPCILLLRDIELVCKDKEGRESEQRCVKHFIGQLNSALDSDWPVFVVATTTNEKAVADGLLDAFIERIKFEPMTLSKRHEFLTFIFQSSVLSPEVNLRIVAQKTAGLLVSDLLTLQYTVNEVSANGATQLCKDYDIELVSESRCKILSENIVLSEENFNNALKQIHDLQSDALGAPKIPAVKWEDIGGLDEAKKDILETIQLPLQYPELLDSRLIRSGILLWGCPGSGKTLLAKAVATECSLNFLSVKGPELVNMYVGQSEQNIRDVFAKARSAAPAVIFFDELDSIAPSRGRSGDSGGVMDRIVSQLLAELDGVGKSKDVFVIGATNRPDLLDSALLRPGRFDKIVHVGAAKSREEQMKIFSALTRNIGNKVLKKNARKRTRMDGKLELNWDGPYTINEHSEKGHTEPTDEGS